MKAKAQRLIAIKQIVAEKKISSQDELLTLLNNEGHQITQATLSRDLKYLKVAKAPDPETGYRYVIPETGSKQDDDFTMQGFPMNRIESLEFAGNLAVMKTKPGFGNSIASVIDNYGIFEVLGTIAGDDTILLINREDVHKNDVINALELILPGIKQKLL